MGKTSLALNIAHNVALKENLPVALFSLEMSKEQLIQCLICSQAEVKTRDLRRGQIDDSDWHRITNAVNKLYRAPIFVDSANALEPSEILAKARRLTGEHGQLGLIVIDYLQLVHPSERLGDRVEEISEIARAFKLMARELKCPVLVLSQLSRDIEHRDDKRPMLSDLRHSGTVGEEADVVMFVYRPSFYHRTMMRNGVPDPFAEPDPNEGVAQIIVAKQRNGPVGTITLGFSPEYARFSNLA